MNIFKGFGSGGKGVGIEITPDKINIAQIQKQGQGYKLSHLSSVEVPEGYVQEGQIADTSGVASLIQSALQESKLKPKRVATAVPGREVVTRLIPVPEELDDRELRDMVLNQEAGLYLTFPREEADVDYQKLGTFMDEDGIEKRQVLLVATRKEVTDTYIQTFDQANLKIGTLDITSFSLIRSIRSQLMDYTPQQAVAIADIEFESTEISIVVEGVPQFSRTVPIGTFQVQSALNRAMNMPQTRNTELLQDMTIPVMAVDTIGGTTKMNNTNPGAAAMIRVFGELADELRRSIDFYLNQGDDQEVAQLFLAGPGGGIGQLDEFFSQRLSLTTVQIDPISALSLEVSDEISPIQRPGLGVVLGLAMREV